MTFRATRTDTERFRSAIAEHIGLQFEDARLAFLAEVLQRRLARLGGATASYLAKLEQRPSKGELAALAQELTVGETYFFRHHDQFRALAEVALPQCMQARARSRDLRLLSAGCASGEEAYSLAIVMQESVDPSWSVAIRAIDLNPVMLEKAERGRYSAWALREAPPEAKRKWFRSDRGEFVLDERVRGIVQFAEGNLAVDDPALWQPAAYDVIFCRNVLMYFAPEQVRATVARIAASLAPGGYLFLGHAETLRGLSGDFFHLCQTHGTFYYRRKPHAPSAWRRPADIDVRATAGGAAIQAPATPAAAWFDTIQQASERIAALVPGATGTGAPAQRQAADWRLGPALDLLRRERFDEALAYVLGVPPEAEDDADVLLVKATLLAQGGRLAAAEETCRRLLMIDGLNAGAHYVLALCREHAGEQRRAMEHDRFAARLDPAFAMPRLHCGLLARQAGDRDGARRELAQALLLLRREDVSRLLLFGGGFSRDALITLCRSAVADCGGRP